VVEVELPVLEELLELLLPVESLEPLLADPE
jgi:hypothetical protein